ncbi:hypothetical protein D3C81_1270310 [compost metagenome]
MDVAHRHPVQLAILTVDGPGDAFHVAPQVGIGIDRFARGRRDLDQRGAGAVLRVLRQQDLERLEPLRQSLRIVEPVDAEQQPAPRVLVAHHLVGLARLVAAAQVDELVHVDADRERLRAHRAVEGAEAILAHRLGAGLALHVA